MSLWKSISKPYTLANSTIILGSTLFLIAEAYKLFLIIPSENTIFLNNWVIIFFATNLSFISLSKLIFIDLEVGRFNFIKFRVPDIFFLIIKSKIVSVFNLLGLINFLSSLLALKISFDQYYNF